MRDVRKTVVNVSGGTAPSEPIRIPPRYKTFEPFVHLLSGGPVDVVIEGAVTPNGAWTPITYAYNIGSSLQSLGQHRAAFYQIRCVASGTGQVEMEVVSTRSEGNRETQFVAFWGGNLQTMVGTFRWYNRTGRTLTFTDAAASVAIAPSGQDVVIDLNKNGVTVWTNQTHRLKIAAGNNMGGTKTFDVATIAPDEYLTIDIDQIGTAFPGKDLEFQLLMVG
jgi:hypothetical protein